MPEGDTVYLTARRLDAALSGRRLRRGELRHPRWIDHDLAGLRVLTVRSVGKHLFIRFDNHTSLHCHLRMDGSWHLYPVGSPWHQPAHRARAVLETADRSAIGFRLHDLRLLDTESEHQLVDHLGPDLLAPDWSPTHAEQARLRLTADAGAEIGLVLLDQRTVAGIGNLYQAEICFLLGVSPWAPVGEVPRPDRAIALARTLLTRNADRPEQSTTGELGRGRQHWVYQRAGQPCRRCGTRIRTGPQGDGVYARTAFYCPRCQPGPAPIRSEP